MEDKLKLIIEVINTEHDLLNQYDTALMFLCFGNSFGC